MATPPAPGRIAAAGVAWYRRVDWPALRALFVDADKLPASFDDWLAGAEATEKRLQAMGKRVVRAELRPQPFADWCAATGRRPDANARTAWGRERAMAEYRQRH